VKVEELLDTLVSANSQVAVNIATVCSLRHTGASGQEPRRLLRQLR
jgi:hypothetical protein